MMKRPPFAALVLLAALLAARQSLGQPGDAAARAHRVVSLDDDDGPVVADAPVAPSALAVEATRLFEAGRWDQAAEGARRVALGEGGDDEGNRGIARYHEAIALLRLGYPETGQALLAPIAERPRHPRFEAALRELASLGGDLDEPDPLAELIDHYPPAAIAHFDTPVDRPLHDRIRYLQGFARYRRGDHEKAFAAFEKVSGTSPLYPKAQFMQGVSSVALHKVVPAARAFFHVMEATERGPVYLRDLATISMARIYYSSNHYLGEAGAPTIDVARLSAALKYWNRIPIESELWPDALFEISWGYFMVGDHAHALGSLNTFSSGYLQPILHPEVDVLRAILHYTVCDHDDAMTLVARVLARYPEVRRDLSALLTRLAGPSQDEAVLRFVEELREGRAAVPEHIRPIAEVVLRDRKIFRAFAHLRAIDAEDVGVERLAVTLRQGPLGAQIHQTLALARRTVVGDMAARVRTLYRDRLGDLDLRIEDARKLRIDIERAQVEERLRYQRGEYHGLAEPEYGAIQADHEHVIWPFDGEYWRDELGSYRQVVRSRCGR